MLAQDVPVSVLAGDIGGTNTRLARLRVAGRKVEILAHETYPSQDYAGLDEIVAAFARSHSLNVDHACFGIAGPVVNDIAETTNLPWRVDAHVLANTFKFKTATLINDLEANAWGVPALDDADFHTLQRGTPQADGHRAVIAAGTGLGEAGLFWDGHQHQPFASEGGHASFSPVNALEAALFTYLNARFAHVSWERVLSGPGLVNLHAFLLAHRRSTTPPWLDDEMRMGDPAAAIAQAALLERDDTCIEALALFVRLYGAEAGNLALKLMATGGVYLGGGIAPRILPALTTGVFMAAFLDKGRMRGLLETIPVRVIRNDQTALFGAALRAADHASNYFPIKKEHHHEPLA